MLRVTHAVKLPRQTETSFLGQVLELASLYRWRSLHIRPARRSADKEGKERWETAVQGDGKGWPDCFLLRPPRQVVAELKVPPNTCTPEQEAWLATFRAVPGVEVFVWEPKDFDRIVEVLA